MVRGILSSIYYAKVSEYELRNGHVLRRVSHSENAHIPLEQRFLEALRGCPFCFVLTFYLAMFTSTVQATRR